MKSYAIVGVGSRSQTFYQAIYDRFKDNSSIVGLCDSNQGRLNYAFGTFKQYFPSVRTYLAADFDKMLSETRPDTVIVCSIDAQHDEYICRSLLAGCDVITEKPMTIDEKKCQRIIDTVHQTGRKVRVAFNYRYSPVRTQVKELLMNGVIGNIISVTFQWNLDTNHGADYFRRWHRNKSNSGGLMVHKATHHFDLVNWWLGSIPQSIFAEGQRGFYTAQQAQRYGLQDHGSRCTECKVKDRCNFKIDISALPSLKSLYADNEKFDGYCRDSCIFDNGVDIEDTMNVLVKYQSGTILTYSLNAFQPWEGYRIEFNGTKGRLEHSCRESSYINGDGTTQGGFTAEGTEIIVYPHFKTAYKVPIFRAEGGHGGGDDLLTQDIFAPSDHDKFGRCADYIQGAYSIIVGIAANRSMQTGSRIQVADLIKGLTDPGYPVNHGGSESIDYVADVKYWHEMAPKS